MALGDNTIKQNLGVQQVQTGNVDGATSTSSGQNNIVVKFNVDKELLKKLGLTSEQYLSLPADKQTELLNQARQILVEDDFQIKGLYVEKTSQKPAAVNTEAVADSPESAKTESSSIPQITEDDWKDMSAKERELYIKALTDETVLKDVPADKKGEVLKTLIDNRIKQNRDISDEKWEKMSDKRKEKIRQDFISDFELVIENGFTKKDFEALSFEDKMHLEIDLKDKKIKNLTKYIDDMNVNFEAGSNVEEFVASKEDLMKMIASEQRAKERAVAKDRLLESLNNLNMSFQPDASVDTVPQKQDMIEQLQGIASSKSGAPQNITLEEFKSEYGHDADFSSQNDVQRYKKMIGARLKDLTPQEQLKYRLYAINNTTQILLEGANSSDPKVRARSEAQLEHYLDVALDLGINDETIVEIENGSYSDEECKLIIELLDVSSRHTCGKKRPERADIERAQRIARVQGVLVERGYNPSEDFDALYENVAYTEAVGDGLRTKKGSKAIHSYLTRMVPKLSSELQNVEFDKNFNYTDTLSNEEDRIAAQNLMTDTIGDLDVKNQAGAFKTIMTSKFDQVQEHAANNIYTLDESVRDWAADYTKSLGKENLTNAIRTEAPAADTKSLDSVSQQTAQTGTSDVSMSSYKTNTISNTIAENYTVQSYEKLSANTKAAYNEITLKDGNLSRDEAVKYFKTLSKKEQSELLKSLPNQVFSKLPITVCEEFPEYIQAFVDRGRGIEIITGCSSITADSAIRKMKSGSSRIKNQLNEFIISNPARFTKISQEHAERALDINKESKTEQEKPLRLKA